MANTEPFPKVMMTSGLVLNEQVKWLSFHSSYDFGYLPLALACLALPCLVLSFVLCLVSSRLVLSCLGVVLALSCLVFPSLVLVGILPQVCIYHLPSWDRLRYLLKLLTCEPLPSEEDEFFDLLVKTLCRFLLFLFFSFFSLMDGYTFNIYHVL